MKSTYLGLVFALLCGGAEAQVAAHVAESGSSSSSVGIIPSATSSVATGLVVKNSPGNAYWLNVTSGASAGYVMVLDSATIPADGAVSPKWCVPIAANAGLDKSWGAGPPLTLAVGFTVVFSTTGCLTKTASATAFISGGAR